MLFFSKPAKEKKIDYLHMVFTLLAVNNMNTIKEKRTVIMPVTHFIVKVFIPLWRVLILGGNPK